MEMRFTRAWGEYLADARIFPNEVLSRSQAHQLMGNGTLVPAIPPAGSKAPAKAVLPSMLRGRGRPRKDDTNTAVPIARKSTDDTKQELEK